MPNLVVKAQIICNKTKYETILQPLSILGVFTTPKSGLWLVSFSVVSTVYGKGDNFVFIYVKLGTTENRVKASSNLKAWDWTASSGGRTIFLNLNKGDTVFLKTERVSSGTVWHINTCFHFESIMLK